MNEFTRKRNSEFSLAGRDSLRGLPAPRAYLQLRSKLVADAEAVKQVGQITVGRAFAWRHIDRFCIEERTLELSNPADIRLRRPRRYWHDHSATQNINPVVDNNLALPVQAGR